MHFKTSMPPVFFDDGLHVNFVKPNHPVDAGKGIRTRKNGFFAGFVICVTLNQLPGAAVHLYFQSVAKHIR